jgi:6-phosphogluconolactonase
MNVRRHENPKSAAVAAAEEILSVLREAQARHGQATLAISGGSSPKPMFARMAAAPGFDWSAVHLFWVDERPVPPDHEQSNYRLADEFLLRPAGIPASRVHRIQAERPATEAAALYRDEMIRFFGLKKRELPRFDCIHLGIGSDGHTASLFPGEPLIEDLGEIAAAVHVRKLNQNRITLLPGVLLKAARLVVLATGEDKAVALRQVLEGDSDPMTYPAQLIRDSLSAIWFIG